METIKNSDKFLELFNKLENYLKNSLNDGEYRSMKQMLKMFAGSHPVLSKYRDALFNYCDLRNAIVHNGRFEGEAIAEPHNEVVKTLSEIWQQLENPERVSIFQKPVRTIFADESIDNALEMMREADISHIPVIENHNIIGRITSYNVCYTKLLRHYLI